MEDLATNYESRIRITNPEQFRTTNANFELFFQLSSRLQFLNRLTLDGLEDLGGVDGYEFAFNDKGRVTPEMSIQPLHYA